MEENSKTVSFEFFPQKTNSGKEKLISVAKTFEEMSAEYFSVTFGAGGSTKRGTLETCVELYKSTKTPIVPHISEELWEINGGVQSVFLESFPKYDPVLTEENTITIAVQVNGKLRGNIEVAKTINNEKLLTSAKEHENVSIYIKDKHMIKEIVVPQRLVNFVVK